MSNVRGKKKQLLIPYFYFGIKNASRENKNSYVDKSEMEHLDI